MSKASEWAAEKTGPYPLWVFTRGKEQVNFALVSNGGELIIGRALLSPEEACSLGRWILETFEEPTS